MPSPLTQAPPPQVHAWSSRWVPQWFFKTYSALQLFKGLLLGWTGYLCFLCDGAWGIFCLLCMPWWFFNTPPCCAFMLGCLRPIFFTFIFEGCVYMYIFLLLFWYCPFSLCIYGSLYQRIYHVSSLISILLQLLLKNLPLSAPRVLRYHPFLF